MSKQAGTVLGALASFGIFGVALWFLHGELAGMSRDAIAVQIRSIPQWALFASIACAICSYATLTGYDAAALKYVGRDVAYRRSALTSFMAFSVGHNVGVSALSGGSIRYRMYSLAGLSAAEIARVIVFVTITFAVGASGLLGVALLMAPPSETALLKLPDIVLTATGVALALVPILYVTASLLRSDPISIGNWRPRSTSASLDFSACTCWRWQSDC